MSGSLAPSRRLPARLALAVLVAAVGFGGTAPRRAAAETPPTVSLAGHGWGHGIGMGQWGALGYAFGGQTYGWILDHYYGGTAAGSVPDNPIRVRIVENDGNDIIVTSGAPFTVAGLPFSAGQAALMHLAGPGSWTIYGSGGCAGPWTQMATASDNGGPGPQAAAIPSMAAGSDRTQVLQLCQGSGNLYLRGNIQGAEIGGVARTVNVLPIEAYLQGVVPSESPAYWGGLGPAGPQGRPAGFQALEAQAVAARTYASAEEVEPSSQGGTGAYGYADICDTSACQVYGGMGAENATATQAVTATAGQVRMNPNGAVAFTQFSSSSGGWTAGGPFPAVVDDGDSVCTPSACNPNHNWSVNVPTSSIQSAYPSVGTLESIVITSRSGPAQADQGGRVDSMTIQGSNGAATTTGATFAARLGLKSDWFQIVGTPSGGLDGYWVAAADGGVFSFGAAAFHGSTGGMRLNKPVVGMTGTPSGNGYWLVAADGGVFTFGDAAFFGSTGNLRLNAPVNGMAPTSSGNGYWLVAADGGVFTFGDARFLGSAGGMAVPRPVVGLAATSDGGGYWLVAADGTVYPFGDAHVYPPAAAAPGAAVSALAPTADNAGYWEVEANGAVIPFGDATAYGSVTSLPSGDRAVAIRSTPTGHGYLVVTTSGRVYPFGDAPDFGGVPDQVPGYAGHALAIVGRPGS